MTRFFDQKPPGLRKSGMPDSVEMPAPVKTTARRAWAISLARSSDIRPCVSQMAEGMQVPMPSEGENDQDRERGERVAYLRETGAGAVAETDHAPDRHRNGTKRDGDRHVEQHAHKKVRPMQDCDGGVQ